MKKITNLFLAIILFISVLSCDERIIPKPLDTTGGVTKPVDPVVTTPKTPTETILGIWVYDEINLSSGTKSVVIFKRGGKNDKAETLSAVSYTFLKGGVLEGVDEKDKKATGKWALISQDKKISIDNGISKSDYDIAQLTDKNFDYSQTIDTNDAGDDLSWVLIASLFGFPDNITTLKVTYKMIRK